MASHVKMPGSSKGKKIILNNNNIFIHTFKKYIIVFVNSKKNVNT